MWVLGGCGEGQRPNVLASAVHLATPVDSLEAFMSRRASPGERPGPFTFNLGSMGTPCGSAGDACRTAHAMLSGTNAECSGGGACGPFVVTTHGDAASRIDREEELLGLLGEIDTPAEAVLVAIWHGLTIDCAEGKLRGTQVSQTDSGFQVLSEWETCGPQQRDTIAVDRDGDTGQLRTQMLGHSGCVVGRRPAGLECALPRVVRGPLGAFFANVSRLEAASVYAFERLARELGRLGAPAELIAEAARSGLDEIRHAQLTAALARRWGSEAAPVAIAPPRLRSRFEIALENAVEGCVRETYGAIVSQHQAHLAADAEVAAVLASIAADELRHAQLSWRIAAWLEPQLTAAERGCLRAAQRVAVRELVRETETDALPPDAARLIGWPSPHVGSLLAARMASDLALG